MENTATTTRASTWQSDERIEHREGAVARTIEEQTAKLPSDMFLWAACGCMASSLLLQLTDRPHASLFIGQWAPTLLILGLYNKLVKVAGSDRATSQCGHNTI